MFLSITSLNWYTLWKKNSSNNLRLCRNCFAFSHSEEQHQVHDDACRNHASATIKMPGDDKNSFWLKNFKSRWFAPFTIYFDFESFLIPVSSCTANPDASSTEVIEHMPSGFALTLLNFVKKLHEMAREVYYAKRRFPVYLGQQVPNRSSTVVLDFWTTFRTRRYKSVGPLPPPRGFPWFCTWEVLLDKTTINFTPIISHNIAKYDLHHVCLALRKNEPSTTISVIPSTDEKYMSMTFGVLIKRITRRDGKVRKIYEYLRFINFFKFLTSSFEKLVANLPASAFAIFWCSKFD